MNEVVLASMNCEIRASQNFWDDFWVDMGSVRGCIAKALEGCLRLDVGSVR